MIVDENKKIFQALMAKKATEWDRMMESTKAEERARGFEEFQKLSDEEVDLASRLVSKSRLKDFVDLKIQYFDQLAAERDAKNRRDGIKKFQDVCDSELELAKAAGPRHLVRGEAEADAKMAKEREEEEEKKRRRSEDEKAEVEKRKEMELGGSYPFGYGMTPTYRMPSRFMPRMMPGMGRAGMPGMGTAAGADSHGAPMHRIFAMEQRVDPRTGTLESGMHDVIPPMGPAYSGMGGPHAFAADGALAYGQFNPPATGEPLRESAQNVQPPPPPSDIDQKLRLLAQLEAARAVLHNHPTSSSASASDEVRSRLRRINRLQMRVIDEILGSKADLSTDFVSELQVQRTRFDDGGGRERRVLKGKHSREPRKIIVELPDTDDAEAHIIAGSSPRSDSTYQAMCTGASDLCPGRGGGYDYADYELPPLCVTTTCVQQTVCTADDMPHCHGEEEALPGPSDMCYSRNYSTFPVLVPQCFPQESCLPPENECDVAFADAFQDDEYNEVISSPAPTSNKPKFVSCTTVIVNTREQAVGTEGLPQVPSAPLQTLQVVQAPAPSPRVPLLAPGAPVHPAGANPTSTSDERFAQECTSSLRRIADSVNNIHRTLSSSSLPYPQEETTFPLTTATPSLSEESIFSESSISGDEGFSAYTDSALASRSTRPPKRR